MKTNRNNNKHNIIANDDNISNNIDNDIKFHNNLQ